MEEVIIFTYGPDRIKPFDEQSTQLSEVANEKGFHVAKIIRKHNSRIISANTIDGFKDYYSIINDNENISGIMFWDILQIGRDITTVLSTITDLTNKGIWVYIHHPNNWTIRKDESNDVKTIMEIVSQYEKQYLSEKTKKGLKQSAKEGKAGGGANIPYGYEREKDGLLVVNQEEAEVVKKIFNKASDADSTRTIARYLNEIKIPTRYNKLDKPGGIRTSLGNFRKTSEYKWSEGTIYNILTSRLYIGERIFKREIFKVPAIIEKSLFDVVSDKLAQRKVKTKGDYIKHGHTIARGKIKCGICEKNYFAYQKKSIDPDKPSAENRYICNSLREGEEGNCGNTGISIQKMDKSVWHIIFSSYDFNTTVADIETITKLQNRISILKSDNQVQKDMLEKKRHEGQNLLKVYTEGLIEIDNFREQNSEITFKKEEISNILDKNNKEIDKLEHTMTVLSKLEENKEVMKSGRKYMFNVLNDIIDRIVVFPVFGGFKLTEDKRDKNIYIEFYTVFDDKPICYIISQRSDLIQYMNDKWYNKQTNKVTVSSKEYLKKRETMKDPLSHEV
jgi:DNA invertase Pin-like site-specific DNA recombinase